MSHQQEWGLKMRNVETVAEMKNHWLWETGTLLHQWGGPQRSQSAPVVWVRLCLVTTNQHLYSEVLFAKKNAATFWRTYVIVWRQKQHVAANGSGSIARYHIDEATRRSMATTAERCWKNANSIAPESLRSRCCAGNPWLLAFSWVLPSHLTTHLNVF